MLVDLKDFIIRSGDGQTFQELSKDYNVNMTKQQRTLHIKGRCPNSNSMYDFIPFDTLDDAEKFEKEHDVIFRKCGKCFRQGKK